jgi:hypothetical protein|tara:strand:- start:1315 stop:1824 length:510 start_codon:yes stop_codon:yes gene_type:complete
MPNKALLLCLLVSFCLINISCSILNPEWVEKDAEGYYVRHYSSCGPKALHKAFEVLDLHLSQKQISRDIQDTGNVIRTLSASLIHHRTVWMSLPSEIKQVAEKYNFNILEVSELKDLDKKIDVAIVLISGRYHKGELHWLCFPADINITKYFGDKTKIHKIFLLQKKVD